MKAGIEKARESPKKTNGRDPLIDHKAVKVYRELARWNTNWIQRKEIALTVDENNQRALDLWKSIVYDHLLTGKFKGNVKALLSEFERLRDRVLRRL